MYRVFRNRTWFSMLPFSVQFRCKLYKTSYYYALDEWP